MAAGQPRPVYSFVVPLFNEEATLPILLRRLDQLVAGLDAPAEIILVDDGSTDTTGIVAAARAKDNSAYRYLALSRNLPETAWRIVIFADLRPVAVQAGTHAALTVAALGCLLLGALYLKQRRRLAAQLVQMYRIEADALLHEEDE